MTRDEEMTDDELRVKAAELMGWKRSCDIRNMYGGMIPQWLQDTEGGNEVAIGVDALPNYPNDISAAWELFSVAAKAHREYKMVEWLFPSVCDFIQYDDGDDMPGTSDVVSDLFEVDARAITRAFILAMTVDS